MIVLLISLGVIAISLAVAIKFGYGMGKRAYASGRARAILGKLIKADELRKRIFEKEYRAFIEKDPSVAGEEIKFKFERKLISFSPNEFKNFFENFLMERRIIENVKIILYSLENGIEIKKENFLIHEDDDELNFIAESASIEDFFRRAKLTRFNTLSWTRYQRCGIVGCEFDLNYYLFKKMMIKDKECKEFVEKWFLNENIKLLLRLKALNFKKIKEVFENYKNKFFSSLIDIDILSIAKSISNLVGKNVALKFSESGNIRIIEDALDERILSLVKKMKMRNVFGIGCLLTTLFEKYKEIDRIRKVVEFEGIGFS